MATQVVQMVGKELGQHGPNTYFKEFSVTTANNEKRNYKLGEFYFVRKDQRHPVCIAEFQLIWTNVKDGRKLAAAKLYFRPEDTKAGRLAEHGEDELMEADRHVPVFCDQVPSWECSPRVPFGKCAYEGIRGSNQYITEHKEQPIPTNCLCRTRNGHKKDRVRTPVRVLSFPAYCRYRACVKLLAVGCNLPKNIMCARGAIEVDCPKTKIQFSRFKFQLNDIDSFALAENIRIPVFKGRPRKRKQSKTKIANDAPKKIKVDKENSNPEAKVKIDMAGKAKIETGNSQTYRIVQPPANSNPERNVIHVKIENKTELVNGVVKQEENGEAEKETDSENIVEMEDWDEDSDGFIGNEGPNGEDLEEWGEMKYSNLLKRENSDEDPPSELVKNGKTGTVLDEAFFSKMMKSEMRASEGIDKEKMKKILVDSCKDPEKFKNDLFVFMKQKGTPIVYVPKVGYTRVDLPKLFQLVVANGGYRQVTLNHRWKKVYDDMVLATTITSAATCMRRHYERLLLPYERYLRTKHRQDALASKTYAITAQASQPLVLTIKKVKQQSAPKQASDSSSRSSSPNENEIPNLPVLAKPKNGEAVTTQQDGNYKQISIPKDVASNSKCDTDAHETRNIPSTDPCSTPSNVIIPATSNSKVQAQEQGRISITSINGLYSASITANPVVMITTKERSATRPLATVASKPIFAALVKPLPSSTNTAVNTPQIVTPVSISCVPIIVSAESLKQGFGSKILTTNAVKTEPNVTKSELLVQPMMFSDQRNGSIASFATGAPNQKEILPKRVLIPVMPISTTMPSPIFIISSHSNEQPNTHSKVLSTVSPTKEVSVITKAMPLQKGSVEASHAQLTQNQDTVVVKKRRGRPPKHSKVIIENNKSQHIDSSTKNNVHKTATIPVYSSCQQVEAAVPEANIISSKAIQPYPIALTTQPVLTTSATSGIRMCAAESDLMCRPMKKGPVKVYEYVVTSDSVKAKLVKHQQGVIALPEESTNHAVSLVDVIVKPPGITTSRVHMMNGAAYHNSSAIAEELSHIARMGTKSHGSYPRVETVMSFANKGCLPSTLMSRINADHVKTEVAHVIPEVKVKREHVEGESNHMKRRIVEVNNFNDFSLKFARRERTSSGSMSESANGSAGNDNTRERIDREMFHHLESKSVIVGPPPLVPIHKQKANDNVPSKETQLPKSFSSHQDKAPLRLDSMRSHVSAAKGRHGPRHISLMSDVRAMKDSFDVDSIIRPLNKEIDQSLEDLRRAAGKSIHRENNRTAANGSRDIYHADQLNLVGHGDRKASLQTNRDVRVEHRYVPHSEHGELRVEVDRFEHHVPHSHMFEHQRRKSYDKDTQFHDVSENDLHANHHLLRIASNDNFVNQMYLHESTKRRHMPSHTPREEASHLPRSSADLTLFGVHAEKDHRSRSSSVQERADYEAFQQRHAAQNASLRGDFHISKYKELGLPSAKDQFAEVIYRDASGTRTDITQHTRHVKVHGHREASLDSLMLVKDRRQEVQMLQREPYHHGDTHHQSSVIHHEHSRHASPPFRHEQHHNGRRLSRESISRESPHEDLIQMHYDHHHNAYRSSRHLSSAYQSSASYPEYPHGVHPSYLTRESSPPVFEHKHVYMADHSPPPSSMHHSWYNPHHLPVLGKDGSIPISNALFWHQKVRH